MHIGLASFIFYWCQPTVEGVTEKCKILVGSWEYHLQGSLQITTLCWNDIYVLGFSGLWPHHPRLIYAWYDSISMPNTIPLELNVGWWERESVGGAEVGQNIKVGVLGGHMSQCALVRFWRLFLLGGPIYLLYALYKNDIGVQPY